jgi:hypothetical protein
MAQKFSFQRLEVWSVIKASAVGRLGKPLLKAYAFLALFGIAVVAICVVIELLRSRSPTNAFCCDASTKRTRDTRALGNSLKTSELCDEARHHRSHLTILRTIRHGCSELLLEHVRPAGKRSAYTASSRNSATDRVDFEPRSPCGASFCAR